MKLRGKGIVYTLGFQKLKNRAFSPSLKASQKEYSISNEAAERENSSRPATVTAAGQQLYQDSSLGWWPGRFSHQGTRGTAKGPPQVSHGQEDR